MLARLLALLSHARPDALGGILVVAASGALAATAQGDVTPITPASPTAAAALPASPTRAPSPSPRPSAPARAPATAAATPAAAATAVDAKACTDAMSTVNAALAAHRTALSRAERMASTRTARDAVTGADGMLRSIRVAANAALRSVVAACGRLAVERDEGARSLQGLVLVGDPAAIGAEAVAAMDVVVNDLFTRFPELAARASATPRPTPTPKRKR